MWWKLFTIYLILLSLIAFFVYAADKKRAKKKEWRIPEATLLALGFFGGAYGALNAMYFLRHKNRRWYFYVINYIGFLWQVALLVYFIVWAQ